MAHATPAVVFVCRWSCTAAGCPVASRKLSKHPRYTASGGVMRSAHQCAPSWPELTVFWTFTR